MKNILEKILRVGVDEIVELHGDASYRTYFRTVLKDGTTRIVMQMPHGKSSVSEEVTNFAGIHKEPPFVNVARFLSSLDLPIPKIFHYDEGERMIILEDVGDNLFIKLVENASNDIREKWYKKAIEVLGLLQRRTALCAEKDRCVAMRRSFDATLLRWEFDHFREYLIEARLGQPMNKTDRELFEEVTHETTDEILKIPYCFTHRDFQSRNLLVQSSGSLVMIDFQDALMGPCIYDLVALLRDSYVELDWSLVERLIECYYRGMGRLFKGSLKVVQRWFNLVTVQRKMKDAGRFVYIDRVKKNPNFLQYIPTTLKYIKDALDQISGFTNFRTSELFSMLKTYVSEWQ